MKANYRYVLAQCRLLCTKGKILDYGCGGGEVVQADREQGLDIVGVEAFYGGGSAKEVVANRGLLGTSVFSLSEDFRAPFRTGQK